MGSELNKLMKSYGVTSMFAPTYSGADKPTEPTDKTSATYDVDKATYDASLANYNADLEKFKQYKFDYGNRIANTPQYLQKQFQTTPTPTATTAASTSQKGPTQEAIDALKAVSGKYDASEADVKGLMNKYGMTNKDVYNITGNYYGANMQAPIYSNTVVTPSTNETASIKDLFSKYLHRDATSADIDYWARNMRNGATTDTMTTYFQDLYKKEHPDTTTTPTDTTTTPATTTDTTTGLTDLAAKYDPIIKDAFTKSLHRDASAGDLAYWEDQMKNNSGVTSDWLNQQFASQYATQQPAVATVPEADPNARGGLIKNYARGGLNDLTDKYDVSEPANPTDLPTIDLPIQLAQNTAGPVTNDAGMNPPAAAPVIAPEAPAAVGAPVEDRPAAIVVPQSPQQKLEELFSKYGGSGSGNKETIKAALSKRDAESDAFQKILANAMKGDEETMPSKSEMYFRLAAALASPTKTRNGFMENVGMAAKEMADYQKSVTEAKRSNRDKNLQIAIKGQELRMKEAHDEIERLRGIDTQEANDRREFLKAQINQIQKSTESQSAAGKAAEDAGFQRGTPEYTDFVKKHEAQAPQNAEDRRKLAEERQRTAEEKLNLAIEKNKEADTKLTDQDVAIKKETEDKIFQNKLATKAIQDAYKLNPNTFDYSLADIAQRKIYENTKSTDPKVVATRQMENLLMKSAIGKLKGAFGTNPTEGERAVILAMEGIQSKSKEERALIMEDAYQTLLEHQRRESGRLEEISSGNYRKKTKPKEEESK